MVRPHPLTLACALALSAAAPAAAAPALRHQLEVNGDFALVGNTLAHDCAAAIPSPVVPAAGPAACGTRTSDSGVDVYWLSDPAGGAADADVAYAPAQAQSTAVLQLPAGAVVRYARVYWAAVVDASAHDASATLATPDGAVHAVTADDGVTVPANGRFWYQSTADVTAIVQGLAEPRGAYTLSGADSRDVRNRTDEVTFAAWWTVVFYELPGDPVTRQLTLFDGLDYVSSSVEVTLSGFLVPAGGWDAKLGVVTYEGDHAWSGDELWFEGYTLPAAPPPAASQTRLSDAENPGQNFFNGTRSWLGAPVSVAGDLPQLTGGAASMSSFDLDVVDLKAAGAIGPGNDAAVIRATSSQDLFALGGFVTSISTLRPSFVETVKAVAPVPDDGVLLAGDTLRYTITATNTGSDASVNTLARDTLPLGVSFVPGSVTFSGPNGGADWDAATRTLTARIGAGADAVQGGSIPVGGSFTVGFDATVDAGTSGSVVNTAVVSAAGEQGDPQTDFPSHDPSGAPGTAAPIDACATDAQCGGSTPACDTAQSPNACVGCTSDAYCSGATPFCDLAGHVCVATSSLSPAAQERTTVAGTGVPLPMALASQLSTAEVYDLDVPGGACGYGVELLDGAGGLVATRDGAGSWSGSDTNANGLPDLGPTGPGGATAFQLRLTPPPGTPLGASCTALVTAAGATSGMSAQASATAHVGAPETYGPDHAGAAAKTVGSGAVVNFPGVVQNNRGADLSFPLSVTATTAPDAGALAPMVFYSDPDGDGDPSDGAPVTETGIVPAFGGRVHVVLQVRASTAGGAALAAGTSISAAASAGAAVQQDEATVGYLATFADAGLAVSARTFAPCSTVHVRATRLPAGPEYVLEWYDRASPVRGTDAPVRTVYPWFVMGGAASDALALGAAAAPGPWTLVVVQRAGGVDAVLEELPFSVERAGAFAALATAPRLVLGAPLEVSASVRNEGAAATLASTNLSYAVTDGASWMDGAGLFGADPAARARFTSGVTVAAGATASDGFTVLAPAWPSPGRYRVDAEWQLSCGATPLVASATAELDVAPPPPVVDTPAGGAVLSTSTPIVAGSARPGASVEISIDGVPLAPLAADGAGRFSRALLPGEALAEGAHAVTATQGENGVTSDPSAPVAFTVDSLPPAVAVTSPGDGALLGAAAAPGGAVTVSGTGEAGASVSVRIGVTTVAATWSGATWSASLAPGDGAHTAVATATDGAGNSAAASVAFTLDTLPPATPVVDAPAAGTLLNATTAAGGVVTVSGSADPAAEIAITVGGQTTTATRAGASFSAGLTLADGDHTASAVATDAAGNTSSPATVSFTLDTAPPSPPAFAAPAPGETQNAAAAPGGDVTVSGGTEAGATVSLDVDGDVRTLPAPAGDWSASFTLGEGAHSASATATDPAGNASAPALLSFSVDTLAPAAPVVSAVASPTPADPVLVTGTAEPGATVRLYEGGVLRGEGTADGAGAFGVAATVGEGSRTLAVQVLDAAGNPAATAPTVAFVVDRTAPPAPGIAAPLDGALLGAADLVLGEVVLSGTAEPNAVVEVYLDGSLAGGTAADGSGAWSLAVAAPEGAHAVRARATDAAGNASAQGVATGFTVDAVRPAAPAIEAPASGAITNAASLTVAGSAPADAVLVRILEEGTVVASGAPASGAFAFPVPAAEGSHAYTAVAVDAAGNVSDASAEVAVQVDRTPPGAPTLSAPATPTNAATVSFGGTAEPGATVELATLGGAVLGTGTADGTGAFAVDLDPGEGTVTLVARARDAAGNAGADSAAVTVEVDRTAPVAPTIDAPADGAALAPGSVEIRGHAEPGAVVTVAGAGTTVTATAAADGAWSVSLPLPAGTHDVLATATDAAGNASAAAQVGLVARADDGAAGGGGCGCGAGGGGAQSLLAIAALLALVPRVRRRGAPPARGARVG